MNKSSPFSGHRKPVSKPVSKKIVKRSSHVHPKNMPRLTQVSGRGGIRM